MSFEKFLSTEPYSLSCEEKKKLLTDRLIYLTEHHRNNCNEYRRVLEGIGYDKESVKDYCDIPFLPVRMFKETELKSTDDDNIIKTMTSSGTSGQKVSKIYLDRDTSVNQQKAMIKIVSEFTGSSRMPMIIIDCPSVIKNRVMFSARGAGILGFSMFGSKIFYALGDDMKLDSDGLSLFLKKYEGQTILLFGFTFMIWKYFYKELVKLSERGISFDLSNGVLIHGGGWKKIENEAVSHNEFHDRLKSVCGINRIHDYYGMVEQTGCIYMQCECGHLHSSIFSDVIIRNPKDFSVCEVGKRGLIQVVSSIPESYPGHSLLTEDEGVILGEDNCQCGRKGKYFKVFGRIKNAEIRGCSDTFSLNQSAEVYETLYENKDVLKDVIFEIGTKQIVENMTNVSPKKPFSSDVIEFLDDLSRELMLDKEAKQFPDIIALAFWARKSSVFKLREKMVKDNNHIRIGRGTSFHIAPSNVPVNYAYSLITGLLCGNSNIVRLSTKPFKQISIINRALMKTLEKYKSIEPYIVLVKYERNKEVNDYFSSICDTRVIWGGDTTINEIRKSPLRPRSTEVTFADRYSLAVFDSDIMNNIVSDDKKLEKLIKEFYNATYLMDQNACTSPRIIVWMGDNSNELKEEFWGRLHKYVNEKYKISSKQCIDKWVNVGMAMALCDSALKLKKEQDNLVIRIEAERIKSSLMEYRGSSGLFYEYNCTNISELKEVMNDSRCQTLGVLENGYNKLNLDEFNFKGIDRIVDIGKMMDFDLIWDGYNLVEHFTREVSIG